MKKQKQIEFDAQLNVRLPLALRRELERLAADERRPLASFVRNVVVDFVAPADRALQGRRDGHARMRAAERLTVTRRSLAG